MYVSWLVVFAGLFQSISIVFGLTWIVQVYLFLIFSLIVPTDLGSNFA